MRRLGSKKQPLCIASFSRRKGFVQLDGMSGGFFRVPLVSRAGLTDNLEYRSDPLAAAQGVCKEEDAIHGPGQLARSPVRR
jgi:hypothetical protein